MNILAIIDKKRYKEALSFAELDFAFNGYYHKKISDYQMSALLMAICLNGLNEQESFDLTEIFIKSGQILDLSKESDDDLIKYMVSNKTECALKIFDTKESISFPDYIEDAIK